MMSQTQIIIVIAIVLIFVAIIVLLRPTTTKSPYETAKESSEIQGLIRHSELPPALIERIRKFEETFAEVYPLTHEEWLDGFKRDQNPENEIKIWEHMGLAYTRFLNSGHFDADARKETFGLLLVKSSTSDTESQLSDLKHLTEDQARSLFALYEGVPQPITIQNTEPSAQPDP
ncbi:MAG: hypothetical protein D3922_11745 [Candidatus Electrothrix sp. AR1]|nr:hypothetical protein [Candidatus Electrothrix sp. AR1]